MQSSLEEELYDQGTEARILVRLLDRLENKAVIDVGAARGSLTRVCHAGGASAVYAFEPFPENVEALRTTFADVPSVRIFDIAVGARDEPATLYVVHDKTGLHDEAYHTLVRFDETPTLSIVGELPVQCRTLGTLVAEGAIPSTVGIVKVDTERADFAVLQGMGDLSSEIVMIEFWDDLAETVGPATYRMADVAAYMRERGFPMFIAIKRHDQFETIQINAADTRTGDWGNVIFVHERVQAQIAPILFEEAALAQTRLVDTAMSFAAEAYERLAGIEEREAALADLHRVAEERREALETTHRIAEERREALETTHRGAQELRARVAELQERCGRLLSEAAPVRVDMLEEQEIALEAYLTASHGDGDGIWRWVHPGLGVLHQHAPIPLQVPEQYRHAIPLSSPPSISIVTPALNAAQFLQETLKSVLGQEYPDLEYIVQDGGSRDDTLSILESHASQLTHVDSRPDSGMAQAVNRGFNHATGEIMAYLNADDLLLPGTLHFVADYFATHPDVDVLYGHRVLIDAAGAEIGRWVMPGHDDDVLSWADFVPQETLFWRRSIWEKAGGQMDETFKFALDWDLLLRFRQAGARFKRVPRFLAAFRVHPGQKTSAELGDVGSAEMERLRTREAGRPVSGEEIMRGLDDYMRRHRVYHKLYRLGVLPY
jgi:FkbM family methyltransferase